MNQGESDYIAGINPKSHPAGPSQAGKNSFHTAPSQSPWWPEPSWAAMMQVTVAGGRGGSELGISSLGSCLEVMPTTCPSHLFPWPKQISWPQLISQGQGGAILPPAQEKRQGAALMMVRLLPLGRFLMAHATFSLPCISGFLEWGLSSLASCPTWSAEVLRKWSTDELVGRLLQGAFLPRRGSSWGFQPQDWLCTWRKVWVAFT